MGGLGGSSCVSVSGVDTQSIVTSSKGSDGGMEKQRRFRDPGRVGGGNGDWSSCMKVTRCQNCANAWGVASQCC